MTGLNGWNSVGEIFSCSYLQVNCSNPFDLGWAPDTELGLKYAVRECLNRAFFSFPVLAYNGNWCHLWNLDAGANSKSWKFRRFKFKVLNQSQVYFTYFGEEELFASKRWKLLFQLWVSPSNIRIGEQLMVKVFETLTKISQWEPKKTHTKLCLAIFWVTAENINKTINLYTAILCAWNNAV